MSIFHIASRRTLGAWLGFLLSLVASAQAPVISTPPTNQSVASGGTANFSVVATGGSLNYQWQRFGTNLVGSISATLVVNNVTPGLGGLYSVVVSNLSGSVTSAPALLGVDEQRTFRIVQLQTNGAMALECATQTGDDRGGLVVSPGFAFLTGDSGTARFSGSDLSGGVRLTLTANIPYYDTLCSNLRDERIYALGNGATVIGNGGGSLSTLIEIDGTTGQTNGTVINLSTAIQFSYFSWGIFSGYDRIVLWDGFYAYDIALPSGEVTFLGPVPNISHNGAESGAFWGIAEYFGNSVYLDYVQSSTTISRIRVAPNSVATTLQQFSSLADMASFSFSPSRSRWFFHYEGSAQFRSGGDETIGSAKAIYSTNALFPVIYRDPLAQTVFPSNTVTFDVVAFGTAPLSYQWRSNGLNIIGATNTTFTVSNVQPSATGNYSVVVSNGLGGAISANASLFVISKPQILSDPVPRAVVAGTNTSFSAVVQAAPPVSYQWRREGTNIPGGTNAIYFIPFVTTADAGSYRLVVTNRYGAATSGVALLTIVVESPFSFKILALSNNAVLAEHQNVTGSGSYGIGISSNKVFVTGGNVTGLFSSADLSGGTPDSFWFPTLVSDLRSERVYTLSSDGINPLGYGGGNITNLIQLDEAGNLTANVITLSTPITAGSGSGLFAGYGQIVIHNGTRVYSIAIPSGVVADLGPMSAPTHQQYGWAYWGIAENFGGAVYLVYVQSPQTIVRTRVPDNITTSIQNFVNLSDMSLVTASVQRGRWYFHYDGVAQFGGTNATVGFCTAIFSLTPNLIVDHYSWDSVPSAVFSGVPFAATISARAIDNNVATNYFGTVAISAVTTLGGQAVTVTPLSSGNFVSGSWTGLVTLAQPSSGISLKAIDFAGRFGVGGPVAVYTTNDLALQVVPSTNAATLYAALTYNLLLTNTGPTVSSGVFATNKLPANVNFVSVATSQGSCALNAGTIVCDVGTMPSGSGVNIAITVVPNALGTLTNVVRIVRLESEQHPENNTNTTIIPVALPALTVTDSATIEGNTPATRGSNVFIVSLNTTSAVSISVNYATATNTALDNTSIATDFFSKFGTLTFAPGMTTTNVSVLFSAERVFEVDETYFFNLSAPANAILVRTQAIGTIINDDPLPGVTITNASVVEGNAGNTLVTIPVILSSVAGMPIVLNYTTSNGTALAGVDFNAQAGQVTIIPGTLSNGITLAVTGETKGESNETFFVNFTGAANITYSTQIVVTIVNDDNGSVLDHFVWNNVGATQLLNTPFTATLTAKDFLDRTVSNYNSSTAFSAANGGSAQKEHIIDVESVSSFTGGPYTIGFEFTPTNTIYVTHMRHYSGTKVSIWNNTGTLLATRGVNSVNGTWVETPLSAPLPLLAGHTYRIGGYNGVVSNPWYYGNLLPTTFKAGTVANGFYSSGDAYPVIDLGQQLYMVDLVYTLSLDTFPMTPTNVALTNGVWSGPVRVLTPGSALQLFVNDNSAQISAASNPFDVLLSDDLDLRIVPSASPTPVSENLVYSLIVSNAGPTSSTGVFVTNQLPANATYISSATDHGSLTVNAGKIVADIGTLTSGEAALIAIAVHPNGVDTLTNTAVARRNEPEVYLGNNNRTNILSAVALTVSAADVVVKEGDSGTTNAVFNVNLSAASTQTVSVAYQTQDSIAQGGADYPAMSGVLVFAPGVTNLAVTVPVYGDLLNELNETFLLVLSNPTNVALGNSPATATIINDDPMPLIYINDINVAEGRNGLTPATFTLSLSQPSGRTVTVVAVTADGSALGSSDYVATNILATFLPGQATAQVTVLVNGDNVVEPDEIFFLNLTSPNAATLAVAQGVATIHNDDFGVGVLDHFEWSAIPSPETIGRTFNVTITARDGAGTLMPFNNSVSFTALSGTNHIPLAPTNSAPFLNGTWTGAISFSGTATNVIIIADDGAGHSGVSNPFDVNIADVSITGATPPEALIASPFNYSIVVSNRGPHIATAVAVTNVLSPDVSFVSASSSAGSCFFADGAVVCDAASLANGGSASIVMVLLPLRGGLLTNVVSVLAFETDLAPGNNRATNVITITGDNDHDGLPDSWESSYGFSSSDASDANQDADGDGATNLQEFIAGTDPQDPSSVLKVSPLIQGSTVQLRFQTVVGKRYVVERAPSPAGPWTPFGSEFIGDGDEASVSDTVSQVPRFCRVRVVR